MRIPLALALLLCGTRFATVLAGEPRVVPDAAALERQATVRDAAARVLSDAQQATAETLGAHSDRLAGLGTDVVDAAVEFLSAGRTPEASDRPSVRVGARERDLLLRSIARVDRQRAMERLRGAATAADEPRRRAAVISALGSVGGTEAVDAILDLVAVKPGAGGKATVREISVSLEDALSRGLARDPSTVARIARRWTALPPDVRKSTLRTAASVGSADAADLVVEVLERDPEHSLDALAEVPRIAAAARETVRERLVRFAADRVADAQYPGRGEAARALGHLRAEPPIPALLDLLEHGDAAERDAALWALRAITGLGFDASPAAWRFWYEEESAWIRDEGPRADAGLANPDAAVATSWLRRIATLRLSRDDWSRRVAEALSHPSAIVRAAACRTLGQLGSAAAVPRLVDTLEDPSPEARDRALAALQRLTGTNLPLDASIWRRKLDEDAAAAAGGGR